MIRDINKYSNNVMAQQLFLTLGLQQKKRGTLDGARATLRQWWNERIGTGEGQPVFDNGSGLSRDERISAAALAKMLQVAWRSPVMPELMSSLPAIGRRRHAAQARAALGRRGAPEDRHAARRGGRGRLRARRQRPALRGGGDRQPRQRGAARPAFDALVDWAAQDDAPRSPCRRRAACAWGGQRLHRIGRSFLPVQNHRRRHALTKLHDHRPSRAQDCALTARRRT